jgi:hypothetical protein
MRTTSYYVRGLLRQLLPYGVANWRRARLLDRATSSQHLIEIDWRAAYYNKLVQSFDAGQAPRIADVSRKRSRYFLDIDEASRGFGPDLRLDYLFGDVTHVPDRPTVVKSRPIAGENANSVLLKLDRLRHFKWSSDPLPFRDKAPAAVWRGTAHNSQRKSLVQTFYTHPQFDIGHTSGQVDDLTPKSRLTHAEQKRYKFFISLEGNDVATNLKWGMASNMLVMSPRLRFETWFMEGLLEPGTHFVLLKDDLSDLEEKVDYFTAHPDDAEHIIGNAHKWIAMFNDPLKERIIATRVLETYFQLSAQL